ncbi:hypothetical protein AA313_de0201549 [Arthrobotrys entomopaga]|nr:hypothetical protein AA313_de0201549 [Arthrobotrys entomopaga]
MPRPVPFFQFAKTVGWNIINFIANQIRATAEQPKFAAEGRRWVNLSRCLLVHSLPSLGSIVILWLNLVNYFIGANLTTFNTPADDVVYLNALQVAAKAQEILVLASLATIVADLVRYRACHPDHGVRFAALTAPFSFTSIAYLFSPEFLSGVLDIPSDYAYNTVFILLLVTVTVAGAFIGPATAVALIPMVNWFPAGGTRCYVGVPPGANPSSLPVVLNSSYIHPDCYNEASRVSDQLCPAAGFYSIKSWSKQISSLLTRTSNADEQNNVKIINDGFATEIIFPGLKGDNHNTEPQSCGQPMIRDLVELRAVQDEWRRAILTLSPFNRGRYRYRYRANTRVTYTSQAPRTLVKCSYQMVSANSTELKFPTPFTPNGWDIPPDYENLDPPSDHSRLQFWDAVTLNITQGEPIGRKWAEWAGVDIGEENSTTLAGRFQFDDPQWRVQWITPSLPVDNASLNVSSARVILYSPTNDQDNQGFQTRRDAHVCSVLSHWLQSTSTIDANTDASLRLVRSQQTIEQAYPNISTVHDAKSVGRFQNGTSNVRYFIDQAPIILQQSWLDFLTPNITDGVPEDYTPRGRNPTTLESTVFSISISKIGPGLLTELAIQSLVCVTINDGLSRVNTNRSPVEKLYFDDDVNTWAVNLIKGRDIYRPPNATDDGVNIESYPLELDINVQGYGYKTDSKTSQWAIALLGGHLLLVVLHIAWTLRINRSYKAWDSLSEYLALALISCRPGAMDNCCAGIERFSTLNEIVRIRHCEDMELKLVFKTDPPAGREETVITDVTYPRKQLPP